MMGVPGGPPPPDAPFWRKKQNKIHLKRYKYKKLKNMIFFMLQFLQCVRVQASGCVLTPYAPGEGDE